MKRLMILGVALLGLISTASAARFGFYARPAIAPYGWYGGGFGYGGYWGGPYYSGWGWGAPYAVVPNTGKIKIDTKLKTAQVFINGALAGDVEQFKSIHLRPGSYNIEVRAPGAASFEQKVYVVGGKTTTLHPDLGAAKTPGP
jgi:hypothetical protein